MPTPNFNRPDNIHTALQYNSGTGLPELRVNLGSSSITITGDVNVGSVVEVSSTAANPVHTHITEVGTSGILALPYLPIGIMDASGHSNDNTHPVYVNFTNGSLAVTQSGTWNVGITGTVATTQSGTWNVNIGTMPEVEIKNDTGNPIPVSGTVNVTQGTDPWIVKDTTTDITIADSTYEMNVARGILAGQQAVYRNGINPDINQEVETSVWTEGGIYPFNTWSSAGPLYVSSDNIVDIGQTILIEGLDANYDLQSEQIVTNGTNVVVTTLNWFRIYSATIISAAAVSANTGTIRFRITSGGGVVVAAITPNMGLTKLGQYTIPRNKTGYVLYGDATSFRSGAGNIGAQVRMYIRPFNGAFIAVHVSEVVNGYYRSDFTIPTVLQEKTDIDVRAFADANNTKFTCNYQLILIDN